jgi:Cytochrome c554 and c-prime
VTQATPGEIAALGLVVAAAAVAVVWASRARRRAALALLAVLAVVTGGAAAALRPTFRTPSSVPAGQPGQGSALGYVSSSACLGCHPGEHASFSRTFHRTMTRAATRKSVRAPLDGRPLELDGRTVRLAARGEEVWATLPDPDAVIAGRPAKDVTKRVVLTTGSHREQAFWVAGERRGDLRLVPFVWLVKEEAFVPRRDAFLVPPGEPMPPVRWASSCIACHAVAGEPRHDLESDSFDTRVAELGVSCEACHGPGAAHVERHRDPVERYAQHSAKLPDPTIVHPARLPPERSAAVCGQCHAYAFPRDEAGWWANGYSRTFRAGDVLEPSRLLLDPTPTRGAPVIDAPASAIFWPDGSVRVGGREYNGLVASPCYERGRGDRKMTCLSCHAMHSGDPAGQIAPSRSGDQGCTTCHPGPASRGHSHHPSGSPGSACVSCHMPKTSYALLSAVRSHRIDSPSAASTIATGKPNACNLCHLDRTLAWTARWLSEWYGAPVPEMPEERVRTATGVFDGLAGDAGVRALVADALGSKDALAAAGADFQRALLEEMGRDPYAAVRFIAARSLRAVASSSAAPRVRTPDELAALAFDARGRLDPERLRALLAARDDRAITIAE